MLTPTLDLHDGGGAALAVLNQPRLLPSLSLSFILLGLVRGADSPTKASARGARKLADNNG